MTLLERAAKRMAPALTRVVPQGPTGELGRYLDVLQGRGAGTGWDLAGEAAVAAAALPAAGRAVVFDGGANYGQWASAVVAAARARGAAPRIFLFEPQRACHEALGRLPGDTVLVPAALGAEPGEAVLSGAEAGFGAASVYDRRDTYFGDMSAHRETVEVVTVDGTVAAYGLDRVDLLKLDVEGAELAALRGAAASLRTGVIRAVAFEFGSANIYSRTFFRDFWDLLDPLGFRLARILPGGRLRPVARYTEELEHFRGVSNYLARR